MGTITVNRLSAFVCVLFVLSQQLTVVRGADSTLLLYASVGPRLLQYQVDADSATLVERGSITLPGYVQEAWAHPSKPVLYVAWSNGGALYAPPQNGTARPPTASGITAFRIDATTGALQTHGESAALRARPIYITCDASCRHLLAAYPNPSGITVHNVRDDGTLGEEVIQPERLDLGIYAHQVRVSPSNTIVIVPTRGNEATAEKPEDPGALKLFRYRDGVLSNLVSIAPVGGIGFRSRHVDFHPMRPWLYLALEAQNKLEMYRWIDSETLAPAPSFVVDTLMTQAKPEARQLTSSVHVHPNGGVVYVANRATGTRDVGGRAMFAGGENSIAVFSIDGQTGEPRRIQNIDTHGIQPRTFAIDPSGRMLVVANQTSMLVGHDATVKTVPTNLAVFRIGTAGRLTFVRIYQVGSGRDPLLWVGIIVRRSPT
jgi:6-phosphogluconolactonase (cycloisomerase 2 family)